MEQLAEGMAATRGRIEDWRENGGGQGKRMPDALWREAVDLALVEGLYATSRKLGIDYSRLKDRLPKSKTMARANKLGMAGFVEVALPSAPVETSKAVVEFVGNHGRRMRIEMTGAVDVAGLMQAFWRSEG